MIGMHRDYVFQISIKTICCGFRYISITNNYVQTNEYCSSKVDRNSKSQPGVIVKSYIDETLNYVLCRRESTRRDRVVNTKRTVIKINSSTR